MSSHAAMSTAPTLTPPGWPFPQEAAVDYRFMPEPNLPPLRLTVEDVTQATHDMPELLDSIQDRLMAPVGAETMAGPCYGLSEYDASVLVGEPGAPAYFEEVRETAGRWVHGWCLTPTLQVARGRDAKLSANWVTSELWGRLRALNTPLSDSPVSAARLGEIIDLIAAGSISGKIGGSHQIGCKGSCVSILRVFVVVVGVAHATATVNRQGCA